MCCEACHWSLTSFTEAPQHAASQSSCTSALVSILFGWFVFSFFLWDVLWSYIKAILWFISVHFLFLTTMFHPLRVTLRIISPSSCCMDTGGQTTSLSFPFVAFSLLLLFVVRLFFDSSIVFFSVELLFRSFFKVWLVSRLIHCQMKSLTIMTVFFTFLELLSKNLFSISFYIFVFILISLIIFPFFLSSLSNCWSRLALDFSVNSHLVFSLPLFSSSDSLQEG